MRWADVRAAFPDRFVIMEALEACSTTTHRIYEQLSMLEDFDDGRSVLKRYGALRRQHPGRELIFAHTANVELDVEDLGWVGPRFLDVAAP